MIRSLELCEDSVLNGKARVVFSTEPDEDGEGIYLGDESSLLTIAELNGSFAGLQTANTNNADAATFEGSLGSHPFRIFTGPFPDFKAVKETADAFAGHTIFDIAVGRQGLKEHGQRAFLALFVSSTGDGWHLSAKVFRGTTDPHSPPCVEEQLSLFPGRSE
jgi:hypothetical protein